MMPAIPYNFIITEQLEKEFLGKPIRDIKIKTISECIVDYMQEPNFCEACKMTGHKITKINYNFIYTDNDYLAEFGYTQIRYFKNNENITHKASDSAKTGSYTVTFIFDEGCLVIVLSGWSCRFNIRKKDAAVKYPFVTKYPVDLTDEEDFTPENFRNWLDTKKNAGITEACVTVKGAFDATVSFMNYVLWMTKIHPKTKVDQLTGKQIETMYETLKQLVYEHKNHIRTCEPIFTVILFLRKIPRSWTRSDIKSPVLSAANRRISYPAAEQSFISARAARKLCDPRPTDA